MLQLQKTKNQYLGFFEKKLASLTQKLVLSERSESKHSPARTPAYGLEPVVASLLPIGALPLWCSPPKILAGRCHPVLFIRVSLGEQSSPKPPLGSRLLGDPNKKALRQIPEGFRKWLPGRPQNPNFSYEVILGLTNAKSGERWLVIN